MRVKVIPGIDICDGRLVKGVKYRDMKDIGDPLEFAKEYERQGADELVILDISATSQQRRANMDMISAIASAVKIPLIMGGGVSCIEDADLIMAAGAKRVTIGTAAMRKPELIAECAEKHGIKSVVVTLDCRLNHNGTYDVWINGGTENTGMDAVSTAVKAEKYGAGRLFITSLEHDGMADGYDLGLIRAITSAVKIPVIAGAGAGQLRHFAEAAIAGASAVLSASMLHYKKTTVKEIKAYLKKEGIDVY